MISLKESGENPEQLFPAVWGTKKIICHWLVKLGRHLEEEEPKSEHKHKTGLSATSAGIAEVYFLSPFARCLKIMKLENTQKGKEENEKGKHRCEHV